MCVSMTSTRLASGSRTEDGRIAKRFDQRRLIQRAPARRLRTDSAPRVSVTIQALQLWSVRM